ncbi:hypothetical protein E2C00_16985 [Streptomyces sp. WAC05374]|uniref:hypothetical protein n=1 Tax=Streptomyces sp. WAC05374 TaxID=2487420 RepID=UPI000F87E0C5|nr:hypothetical protein [Streptomyces sp. WAC05374]RST12024.1 hypothetical protein EF905_23655 [Streptomyces sp. WAC05374]TDF54617.1 hypothetical protein E2C00_16985 [Streptomyces sp. WAC05374]TDF56252.1 hypothetical protein E2C02_12440 [Streptomyces sp. WAC05374]
MPSRRTASSPASWVWRTCSQKAVSDMSGPPARDSQPLARAPRTSTVTAPLTAGTTTWRPQSKFLRLTDAEFAAGLRRLAADARAEPEKGPQTEPETGPAPEPAPGRAPGPMRGPVRAPAPVAERYGVVVLTA